MTYPGRQQSVPLSISISAGAGTGTLTAQWDIARWIRVTPVAETDTYGLTLKDADGNIILNRSSVVGTFSERVEMSLGIVKTVNITGATQDGTYKCFFDMH